MKTLLKKLFGLFFGKKENIKFAVETPLVTEEEAYIPFRSEILQRFLLSKRVDLNDPIDASVKIRRNFKSTPEGVALKGTINTKRNITINAKSDILILNLKDLILSDCNLIIKSALQNTIVVINVSNTLRFTRSKLDLRGISPENVLINYTGASGPSLFSESYLCGTIVTLSKLSILRGCHLEGETLGSVPVISNGTMVNKTTKNTEKLQAERKKQLEEKERNGGLDSIIK